MESVIVAAARTPIGRRAGALAGLRPDNLVADLIVELIDRAGVPSSSVDDVLVGCGTPVGEQGWNIARQAILAAGLPHEIPGITLNRMCGSSDQSVRYADQAIRLGEADVVVAAGVESMSRVPMTSDGTSFSPRITEQMTLVEQGKSAELIAERWGFSRQQMDEYSLSSHQRAAEAQAGDLFKAELASVYDQDHLVLDHDEGVRHDTSLDQLATLRPAFRRNGAVTAGNSSQMSDGAAGMVLTSTRLATELGLVPRARVLASVSVGSEPVIQLTGVIDATRKALARAGLTIDDIDHFEINEAFSVVPLLWMHEFGVDPARVNPRGGAIALGHPLGATGARLMVTMLHALERDGGRYGLQTMCIGHGMANATIIEVLHQ